MLELGWTEILVIAIVMIVVVGPKDLPKMLRSFGRTMSTVRTMAGDFRKQFDEAIKEAELDEVRNLAAEARKLNPASELKKAMSPMEIAARDVKAGLDNAMKPKPATPVPPATAEVKPAAPLKNGATAMPGEAAKPAKTAAPAAKAPAAAAKTRPAAKAKAPTKPKAHAKPKATASRPPKGGTAA